MTYDPLTIAAFVDGELDDLTTRRIANDAEQDAVLAAAIARHRALTGRLAAHYDPVASEAVPDRLMALLKPALIDDSLATRRAEKQARRQFGAAHWGAMAASLIVGLTIGISPWTPAGPVASDNGVLIAAGPLARALDTQLASTQTATSDVRIGMTFRDRTGRYCRTFDSATLGGIGCRDNGTWQLEQTVGGTAASDYRQAGSGAVAGAAAQMMAGEPFDAKAEQAAQAANWAK